MRRRRGPVTAALLTVAACVALGSQGLAGADAVEPDRFDTVILDAGHGGEDDGARGDGGLVEKDLVLDVARRLGERLEAAGYRVVHTRTEDRFVSLQERVAVANDARGDLFVSIHANAAKEKWVRGVETFFLSLEATDDAARELARAENQAFEGMGLPTAPEDALLGILGDLMVSGHMVESNEFARMAQEALAEHDSAPSRGVKQAPFVVLMGVQMPACLVELGFLSNRHDERALGGKQRRQQAAEALARSVIRFAERYDARRGVPDVPSVAAGGGSD